MRKQKDILWKGVLEQLFEDFLLLVNPNLAQSVDLSRGFEFLNKELNQKHPSENGKYEQKIVDKLVKLYTKDGKQVLMHVEVQDKYNKDFGKRMYSYYNRLMINIKYQSQHMLFLQNQMTLSAPMYFVTDIWEPA